MNTDAHCLLWDFGDTLCDERFIFEGSADWMALYETFNDGPAASWCRGELDIHGFAVAASSVLSLSPEDVIEHMQQRCRQIVWFPKAWSAFRRQHRPQAIVTVNPDIFTLVIMPMYKLDHYVDTIVTSWEEGTNDKADLCSIALSRMKGAHDPSRALLIDNKKPSVDDWMERGGMGYHFTTDDQFEADFMDS